MKSSFSCPEIVGKSTVNMTVNIYSLCFKDKIKVNPSVITFPTNVLYIKINFFLRKQANNPCEHTLFVAVT